MTKAEDKQTKAKHVMMKKAKSSLKKKAKKSKSLKRQKAKTSKANKKGSAMKINARIRVTRISSRMIPK